MTRTVLLKDLLYPVSETMRFTKHKVVFLNTSDIDNGKFNHNNLSDPTSLPGQAKKKIKKDDILFSEIRPANKRFAYVDFSDTENHVVSTKLMVLRCNNIAYPRYAYYWITAPQQLAQLQVIAESRSGTFPQITFDTIKNLKVILPEYPEQVRIADFVDAIDEKIELNQKMNDTLEQMGQALFMKYFNLNIEAQNWGKIQIGKKINPRRGKSLQSRDMIAGKVPVVSGGLQPAGYHNESNTSSPVITVSASGANAGFVALWEEPVWSADSCYIDTTITNDVYFYYLFMKANQTVIYGMQTGSGQPHIYPKHIELLEIPNAPQKEIETFGLQVKPLFKKIHENKVEIETLTTLRDSLLPRLINGKISI